MEDIDVLMKLVNLQLDCMEVSNLKFCVSKNHPATTQLLKATTMMIAYLGGMLAKYPPAMLEEAARKANALTVRINAKDLK